MITKELAKKEFQKKPEEYWEVPIFREKGFSRKKCTKCGKFFWSLSERRTCGDSSCEPYGFIGNTITKKKLDYTETWKTFEKFFIKEGHESVKRYPVIDRIRPDLYFTIASIQNFQRLENGNMAFVYPANPLIVPQPCLRFVDIPSVGLSGRHLTSFVMPGQHAFGYPKEGYFKERCMELNYKFLTGTLGMPPEEIVYVEDIWAMPDMSAFGPSIETFSRGLELVNHVFMQFQKSGSGYKELEIKVNDTGWGHERLVWFSNGTPTMYDCTFGEVIEKMKRQSGISPDKDIAEKYYRYAGILDIDEISPENAEKAKKEIAEKIGISVEQMKNETEPLRCLYAIADHIRTLLFAVTDGGIPSNVGGGYNLRVILRRAIWMNAEYNLNLDFIKIAEMHAKFLKPLFPELSEGLPLMEKILPLEEKKYENMRNNAKKIISKLLSRKEELTEDKIIMLYESHGITPEIIGKETGKQPENIYTRIAERHQGEQKKEEKEKIEVSGYAPTKLLFYEDQKIREFEATVTGAGRNYVILDSTYFYPEGGGQESDTGYIEGKRVYEVKKIGNVVVHYTENPEFREGQRVKCRIDWERREQLVKHHTAIHILGAAARRILGSHIFQAGTHKSAEKAHLDITHYQPISREEEDRIEDEANRIARDSIPVKKYFLERAEAERLFGTRIYQGGYIPGKKIRIVEIIGTDVQACGGTHADNTSETGRIVIVSTERIQDGIDRITIMAGRAAENYIEENMETAKRIIKMINSSGIVTVPENVTQTAYKQIKRASEEFSVSPAQLEKTIKRFLSDIESNKKEINYLEKETGKSIKTEPLWKAEDLKNASRLLFDLWKYQKKTIESLKKEFAERQAEKISKKARHGRVFEIVNTDRKGMIEIATSILNRNPDLTVVLANVGGEIVCMSRKEDMKEYIKKILEKTGGSGGGTKELSQGRTDLSKLRKIIGQNFL